MPIISHKFTSQKRADAFANKLAKAGYRPWQILRKKGFKIFYVVEYQR